MIYILLLIKCAISSGTSLLFASVSEVITERSGVLNLGLEGIMLIGAFSGFYIAKNTNNLLYAVCGAFIVGCLFGGIHSFITVILRANQVVSGLAITLLGSGCASFFGKNLVGQTAISFSNVKIPLLYKIPLIGPFFDQNYLVYFSYFFVAFAYFFLFKTKYGLNLRVVGDSPLTADTMGVSVTNYRIIATSIGSGFTALGGAYLSLADTPSWMDQMSGGRGWIAIAIVIFARWNPFYAAAGAYLFGGFVALQFRLQAFGFNINIYFLKMLPYIATLAALVIFSSKKLSKSHSTINSLGLPYDRENKN